MVVLSVVVESRTRLGGLREVRITRQSLGGPFLLQLNAGVDQIQALLDFGRDGCWCGDVIAGGAESLLVGDVLDDDLFAVGSEVRVGALLDEGAARSFLGDVLQESGLGGVDVVAGLVRMLVAAVIGLLLVVLEDRDPGGDVGLVVVCGEFTVMALNVIVVLLGQDHSQQAGGQNDLYGEFDLINWIFYRQDITIYFVITTKN